MNEISIKCDIGQALARTRVLMFLDKAAKKQATDWLTKLVTQSKLAAGNMKKSGRTTSFMKRNIGMYVSSDGKEMAAGTGIGGAQNVVYAAIQDGTSPQGQVVKPKGKYLAIPFKGIPGNPRNYANTFVFKAKSGNLIMMQKNKDGKPTGLFTLVKQVTIPRSGWFTDTLNRLLPELNDAMTEEMILTRAVIMAGK